MTLHSGTRTAAWIRALLLVLTAVPFLWFSAAVLSPQFKDIWLASDSSKWPVASGVVFVSTVEPGPRNRGSIPTVHYAYKVDGEAFAGNKVQFGNVNGSLKWAKSTVERFPPGPVEVRYDPQSPWVSVLVPSRVRPDTYFLVSAMLLFGGIGVYCIYKAIQQLFAQPIRSVKTKRSKVLVR